MATATVPNAGTFDLEIDTGFIVDAFTLDSATKGVLDSTVYVLEGTTSYASVTTGVISASINRGRRDPLDPIAAGMFSFVLNDTLVNGLFGPFDTSSPFYNDVTNVPGLAPGREVRFTRYDSANNPEYLFVGTIVNYDYNFALGGLDTVTVLCADGFYKLANTYLTGHNPTKEFTGARINAILDRAEVDYPTGAARDISTGTVELGGGGSYAIPEGTNVKAYFDDISYSAERGRIFLSRDNVLVSQDRTGVTLSSPVVLFSDSGDTPYQSLGITFQAENIINRAAVTPAGGSQQVAEDLPSQAEYFVKSLYIDRSLLHDNTAALDLANYLLFPEPEPRFDAVETSYTRLTAAQRDACAIVDLGDTVQVSKKVVINGTPTTRTEELSVEGIEHRIGFASGMTSRYFTAPTNVVYALILDDPNNGLLDFNSVT
jgi:hypothetical protein